MSCDGTMIGEPLAGCRMLFVLIISVRASSCASSDSCTCTAIWSPSKSALNAAHTSGCSWIALPSISTGSNAWMPRRWSVGARLSSTGCSRMTSSRMSQTSGFSFSTSFFACLKMALELRTHDNDGAPGVIHALAEQVLPEPALLALEHVGERFQRPLVGAGDHPAAPAVVEQRVDRLLQHALLVADDDVRRAQLDQPLEPVVAVDHPPIEIVEVRGGEASAVERHQRPQVGRNHRNHREHHPLRLVAGLDERFDQLQAFGELLRLEVGGGFRDLLAQIRGHLLEIERLEHVADGFGADHRRERIRTELVLGAQILVLGQQLPILERREPRLDDDVMLEIEDALEILERHVEQQPDAARQRLEEPDVRDRSGKLDVAHALAPHPRQRDLDPAFLADDALVLHALVLAAQALVVLDRTEDAGAEQSVALRLEGPVVDRLRLLDLAVGPRQNLLRARDRDPDLVEDLRRNLRAEEIHHFLIHRHLLSSGAACAAPRSMGELRSRGGLAAPALMLTRLPRPRRRRSAASSCANRH